MVGYRAASHSASTGAGQVYARRDRHRALERTEDSREITGVGHLFERHRWAVVFECSEQPGEGPHRGDAHLIARDDVAHAISGPHAERLAHGLGQRRLALSR